MRFAPLALLLAASSAHAYPRADICKAAQEGKTRKIQQLLDEGVDVDDPSCDDQYCEEDAPVWCATKAGSLDALKVLAKAGAKLDVTARWSTGEHDLLLAAAYWGHVDIVDWLIAKGRFPVAHKSSDGKTPLHVACQARQTDVVTRLLARGVKVDARLPDGTTPLMIAAGRASVPIVDALLAAGADATLADQEGATPLAYAERLFWEDKRPADLPMVVQRLAAKAKDFELADKDGVTALMRAVRRGDKDLATRWLDLGAKVDARAKDGRTALHLAVENPPLLSLLLARGANPASQDERGRTPLHLAVRKGLDPVERLLAAKAPLEVRDKDGKTPFATLASERELLQNKPLRDRLLAAGANHDARGDRGRSALHYAVMLDDAALVRDLLGRKADPNAADSQGYTPLMFASTKEIAELLLARGARLDARNQRGDTLLIVGSAELVEYFLDKGVDPRQVSSDGWSALTVAARRGRADLVKRLLAKGVPVDLVIKPEGWSALHFAAYNRDAAVVALLVQAGANVRLAATRGETAFVAAFSTDSVPMTVYDQYVKGDSRPVATILLDKGAAIDATDDHGRSALMYAARRGDADAVRFLVERGADAKLADDEGKRALDFAREGQATAVVTVLQPLTPAAAAAQAPTAGGPRWPYLSEREITQAELDALSREDLVIARNEVYARHGYSFKRPELAAYFAKQPWYKVDPAYDEKSLTDLERKNIRLLLAAEKARK